ncbi:MAG: septum formation initiator family protein [Deltaproteobacteria bacterium]|nr:septum formation initiator family protein [Deltaproteobacteria bacterium]
MISRIQSIKPFASRVFRSLSLRTWLSVLGISLFLWFWIFGHQGLYQLEHLLRAKRGMVLQQKNLVDEKKELEAEIRRLNNPRYQKHLIHKELGFVEKGEVLIQIPNP